MQKMKEPIYLSLSVNQLIKLWTKATGISKRFTFALCKTYPPFLLIENEELEKIGLLIGNDLETSEVLYSTLFYINSKERFPYPQMHKTNGKQSNILLVLLLNHKNTLVIDWFS